MMKRSRHNRRRSSILWGMAGGITIALPLSTTVGALPPPEDTPEEILRTEIILEARSPVNGRSLTASEYVDLQEDLAESENPPTINTETRHLIFLIQIRKVLNIISPVQIL